MLDRKDLEKYRTVTGFNMGQIEKDYLQHLFLLFLSRYIKDELVFKGGTAIQKVYALNRFSEDLDFTLLKEINMKEIIERVSKDISNFGFKAKSEKISSKISENYRLKIKGPLYDGTERTISSLKIEISLRNDLILEPDLKEIVPIYTDTQPYLILIMNIKEALAEKIRTIFQREKARDIYDIWFLLKKGIELDYELIDKKMQLFNLKFKKDIFIKKMNTIKRIWQTELKGYVSILPDFEEVKKFVSDKL